WVAPQLRVHHAHLTGSVERERRNPDSVTVPPQVQRTNANPAEDRTWCAEPSTTVPSAAARCSGGDGAASSRYRSSRMRMSARHFVAARDNNCPVDLRQSMIVV